MGLLARALETVGIPTICVSSALDVTLAVKPPRSVFVNFPLGHQTGRPNQPDLQRGILLDALRALETISVAGTVLTLPYVWDENDDSWEDREYRPGYLPPYSRGETANA